MKITIQYNTGNSAFEEEATERGRLVRVVTDAIDRGIRHGNLKDFNDNHVGAWAAKEEK